MALSGKLIGYVEISKKTDFFDDLLRHKPHELAAMVPHLIHDCELHEGDRGAVESVVTWHYTHGDKKRISKVIIKSVDEENHTIVFKLIGGGLVETYKSFTVTFHVESKGDVKVATWTHDFERPDTNTPYPTEHCDFNCQLTKEIDAHNNGSK